MNTPDDSGLDAPTPSIEDTSKHQEIGNGPEISIMRQCLVMPSIRLLTF